MLVVGVALGRVAAGGWLGRGVGGVLVVYACGIAVLSFRVGFVPAVTSNFLYLPGDALKVVVAAVVVKQVHRAYPELIVTTARGDAPSAETVRP